MNRRAFFQTGATVAATAVGATAVEPAVAAQTGGKFKLKYAPHFGMFQNHAPGGPIDELKFAADQGFSAWEDNGMKGRSKEEQEKIAKEMERLGITMGVFVVNGGTSFGNQGLAQGKKSEVDKFLNEVKESLDVAKRVNAKWATVVPGERTPNLQMDFQTANVIDALKRAAEICEKTGLVMVLEPLNHWRDHPNLFLADVPQGYMLCRAVGSPSCKVLYDMYHAQIQVGNIIPNMDKAWNEVAYYQIGDNPGRNEPGSGEMNYRNIFKHIQSKGYTGVLGMEHGISQGGKEGEVMLIKAYRDADNF